MTPSLASFPVRLDTALMSRPATDASANDSAGRAVLVSAGVSAAATFISLTMRSLMPFSVLVALTACVVVAAVVVLVSADRLNRRPALLGAGLALAPWLYVGYFLSISDG